MTEQGVPSIGPLNPLYLLPDSVARLESGVWHCRLCHSSDLGSSWEAVMHSFAKHPEYERALGEQDKRRWESRSYLISSVSSGNGVVIRAVIRDRVKPPALLRPFGSGRVRVKSNQEGGFRHSPPLRPRVLDLVIAPHSKVMTTYRRLRPIHRPGFSEQLGLGGLADGGRRDFSLYCLALSILADALEESPREVRRSLLPACRRGRLTLAATLVGRWAKELTGIVAQARLGQAGGRDRVVVEINKLDVKQWSAENLEI